MHGGKSAGTGIIGDPHVRLPDRSLRPADRMGADYIPGIPQSAGAVPVLSGVLADHGHSPHGYLLADPQKIPQRGRAGLRGGIPALDAAVKYSEYFR